MLIKNPLCIRGILTAGLLLALVGSSYPAFSQRGYVKLIDGDSVIPGYMRHYISASTGEDGWEVWKTKTDKHPRRIAKSQMYEFAIKKDTFMIIREWTPFPEKNLYFLYGEAVAVSRGKVNLYVIPNFRRPPNRVYYDHIAIGAGINGVAVYAVIALVGTKNLYILEDSESHLKKAIPNDREKRIGVLKEFMPEKYIDLYVAKRGPIGSANVAEVVKLYNSK